MNFFQPDMTIYNSFSEDYKKPFGAVRTMQKCEFRIRLPKNTDISELTLVMFRPGFKERFIPMQRLEECHDELTDIYFCEYAPRDKGLHQYYFTVLIDGARRYIKRNGAAHGDFNGDNLFQLTVFDETFETPEWLKGGILYQIFPDRFYKSGMNNEEIPSDRIMHDNWYETPLFRPNEHGKILNNDYYGGDLKGIEQKLDYLADLGVTCLYLTPIFEAHENHRYNTADYEKIDPLLGNEDDFVSLCERAKEKGINIILDGVFSHTGADSRYFNKNKRYGEGVGAFNDENSPFRSWYSFVNYPNEYESWWGIVTLPNVNENNPHYTNYICGEDGIIRRWIRKGAKGWRLDVADELPDEFIDNIHLAVKAEGKDKILYGEVWEDASNKESYGIRRRYLAGDQLDSVMNYPFKEAILNYAAGGSPTDFQNGVMTILEHYPKPAVDVLMNFLSTHDTERAITRLGGEPVGWHDREWQAERFLTDQQYAYALNLLKFSMVLQFFLPGVPCIYYADEAGLEGYKDPFNRRCYPWGKENHELIDFVKGLADIRQRGEMFAHGELEFLKLNDHLCVFMRVDKTLKKAAIIAANKATRGETLSLEKLCKGKLNNFRNVISGEQGDTFIVSPFSYQVYFGDL